MDKLLNSENEDNLNMEYLKSVFAEMNELRKEGNFSDVTIECDDGRSFQAHRLILASSSPYFRAMFTHNMQESQQKVIKIRQVDSRVLEELLNFAYSGKTKLLSKEQDFLESLLVASNMLQFQQVEDACISYMRQHISLASYDRLRSLAQLHPHMALKDAINDFIIGNFCKVINTPAFLKFDVAELEMFLSDPRLNVYSETQTYEALLKWVNYSRQERVETTKILLPKINLPLIPKSYLTSKVVKDELMQSDEYSDLFKEACEYQQFPERRCLMRNERTTPRKYMHTFIYVIGGYDRVEERFLSHVDCYDTTKGVWLDVAAMETPRIRHGVTVLDGMIYAVGGQCDDDVSVRTVERYDPVANKWDNVSSMNECKGQLAVAVCDGKIYCIGGTDDLLKVSLNCVECYDPVTNTWCTVAPMPTARGALGAATLNGKIYAVGGGDFHVALDTAEVYDPKTDKWSTAPSMNFPRGCLGLACVNSMLYAFGGAHMHNGMMTYLEESIECFDPKMNRWLLISGTEISCWGVGICAIPSAKQPNQTDLFIVGGIYEFTERDKMLKVTITEKQIFCTPFPKHNELICRVHTGAVALNLPPG